MPRPSAHRQADSRRRDQPVHYGRQNRGHSGSRERRRLLDSSAGQAVPRPHWRTDKRNSFGALNYMGLLEIAKLPTAENAVIHLNPADNIAIARVSLSPGQELRVNGRAITVEDPVPAGHKVAIAAINAGENVLRYGQIIGRARNRIEPGRHVHTHNISFEELSFAYEFPASDTPVPKAPKDTATFLGYQREDGRVGTRNYIAVVAASNCAAHTAELIAESFENETLPPNIDGVAAFPHGEGCGHSIGPDTEQLQRTLAGTLAHPNVAAAIILGLGCETNQISHYLGDSAPRSSRLIGMTLQESGGTKGAVEAARRHIH